MALSTLHIPVRLSRRALTVDNLDIPKMQKVSSSSSGGSAGSKFSSEIDIDLEVDTADCKSREQPSTSLRIFINALSFSRNSHLPTIDEVNIAKCIADSMRESQISQSSGSQRAAPLELWSCSLSSLLRDTEGFVLF